MQSEKPVSQEEMLRNGAGGYLSTAYLGYIPLSKIDGLEPKPANNRTDDGEYYPGVKVEQPVEVSYEAESDSYMLWAGNHRYHQAVANGQTHLLAYIGPDLAVSRRAIGSHVEFSDPDAGKLKEDAALTEADVGQGPVEAHSDAWFEKYLTPSKGGDPVPERIRMGAIAFCREYGINGICDPMYISNVIALSLRSGDGSGKFGKEPSTVDVESVQKAADVLASSFRTCISKANSSRNPLVTLTDAMSMRRPILGTKL